MKSRGVRRAVEEVVGDVGCHHEPGWLPAPAAHRLRHRSEREMATRVLVKLAEGADVQAASEELRRAGAAEVTLPRPELPGVAVAVVPDEEVEPAVERFRDLETVESAEPDALRWSM
jgi:hypothetical protein